MIGSKRLNHGIKQLMVIKSNFYGLFVYTEMAISKVYVEFEVKHRRFVKNNFINSGGLK
jgi:hypothetical protein